MTDSTFAYLYSRVKTMYFRHRYMMVARKVLTTPPIGIGNMPFILLSMVHHRDVYSYLVAVKSFVMQANPSRIVVVCDPSITGSDRIVLKTHIPYIELVSANKFTNPDIPHGGCWERLWAITHYVTDMYVVQLDADTITVQSIPEVVAAIHGSNGFVLGEEPNQTLLNLSDASHNAIECIQYFPHIQTYAETAMGNIGLSITSRYVRGCAGFTGFPRTNKMREQLLDFSTRMSHSMGNKWSTWGTEQVTSNYLVANAQSTIVLPFPKYGTPDVENIDTSFLHFIGPMRFLNNSYQYISKYSIQKITYYLNDLLHT